MSLSVRQMRSAVSDVISAIGPLDGESDGIRATAFARLLDQRLEFADRDDSGGTQPERVNPWTGQTWTPEERSADLARRWETEAKHIPAIVDVEADEPWLRLPAAALSSDRDEAIRELTLLLVSARIESLFNTAVDQVSSLTVEYGLPAERVVPVLESMDRREILLIKCGTDGAADIYMQPAGGKIVRGMVKRLSCHARG